MEGFDAGETTIPAPLVQVADETRERLIHVAAAMIFNGGAAPAEIMGYLENGFPPEVVVGLERVGEREEINDYVSVLLHAMQMPEPTT